MIPLPPWAYAAAAGLVFAAGFGTAWKVQGWRWQASEVERLEDEAKAREAQLAQANAQGAAFEQDRVQIDTSRHAGETTIRTVYETRTVPADCELAPDARGVLEQALQRANSAAGQSGKPVPDTP